MTSLSVVVPCFNCRSTLEDAVASVYRQQPIFPFDVTLVDDASTDSTYAVMARLAQEHPNIKLLRHAKNLGGGAARNTGIDGSAGDLVFCLDGDDMLGPGFLENMTRYWNRQRSDGLGMSTSIKFRGHRIEDVAYTSQYEGPGEPVRFESFLEGNLCSLNVVFLIRRAAYEKVGGYPTEHGFDTQGMAFRFLCNGLCAYTCPGTTYYHRVSLPRSYYRREQAAGRLSWNWFNVFDEFLYIFGSSAQARILEHPLFDVPGRRRHRELSEELRDLEEPYARGYRRLLHKGPAAVAREFAGSRSAVKQYWLGNFHRLRDRPAAAIKCYTKALGAGFKYRIIYYRMLQAELALARVSLGADAALDDITLHTRPFPLERRPLSQRLFHAFMSTTMLRPPAMAAKRLKDRLRNGHR